MHDINNKSKISKLLLRFLIGTHILILVIVIWDLSIKKRWTSFEIWSLGFGILSVKNVGLVLVSGF
jgi:hypothetical protein